MVPTAAVALGAKAWLLRVLQLGLYRGLHPSLVRVLVTGQLLTCCTVPLCTHPGGQARITTLHEKFVGLSHRPTEGSIVRMFLHPK